MDWIVTFLSSRARGTTRLGESVAESCEPTYRLRGEEAVKFRLSQGEVITILDAVSRGAAWL